jgi:hypothetical protein
VGPFPPSPCRAQTRRDEIDDAPRVFRSSGLLLSSSSCEPQPYGPSVFWPADRMGNGLRGVGSFIARIGPVNACMHHQPAAHELTLSARPFHVPCVRERCGSKWFYDIFISGVVGVGHCGFSR